MVSIVSNNNSSISKIKVSFIVIALNASSTITETLQCLCQQTYPHELIEVILIDGNSNDNTKDMMIRFQESERSFARVKVFDNPQKTLPCGWNIALDNVSGDAILRVDAHTKFPNDFIELNVRNLINGEDICGGKVLNIPQTDSEWGITINEAENSMFGGSIAAFRHADKARYVDTLAFAMYRKKVMDSVGRYNELLSRTEDNEMHYRMRKAGFRFYYDPEIVSCRYTRASFSKLLQQKYMNGFWIGKTLKIEPRCFSLYHFIPGIFVAATMLCVVLSAFKISWPLLTIWGAYIMTDILMSIIASVNCSERNLFFVALPFMFMLLHVGYGMGTIIGLFSMKELKPE